MGKFEEIYEKIVSNCKEIEKEAKERRISSLIIDVFLIIVNILLFISIKKVTPANVLLVIIVPFLSTGIIIYLSLKNYRYYRVKYKDEIIDKIIKEYDNKLYYDKNFGISASEYRKSGFDNDINKFKSEDRIHGRLLGKYDFQMAEVMASKETTRYVNGETEKTEVIKFYGLYGTIKLEKDTFSNIAVLSNYYANMYKENRIEMESSEFEKNYDLISKEKITALKIFKPELIEKFNEIKRINPKNNFEVKIIDDTIHFRYSCKGSIFEPPKVGLGVDKEFLKKYFNIIYYPIELLKELLENIENVE